MGLFSFVKDAGAKLFGIGAAKADAPAAAGVTAEALEAALKEHGFSIEGLTLSVDGDKAVVSGKVATTEEAEKIVLALGNVVGVASVDNQLEVDAPSADAVFYTVKKGDTLWKIAETHYGKGNGAKYTEIVKANTPPVKNPDLILPGWVLRIPPLK
ncbi:MAG: peptidoglycan-binding protein LysM [Methylobacteriaceae bacterium]|jgi:nucleoid-associated protein YgaU|nr:peptidoglycan-binding protein LysM [Methylobacteriaceae bacterium]